jgi:hypothetical protein
MRKALLALSLVVAVAIGLVTAGVLTGFPYNGSSAYGGLTKKESARAANQMLERGYKQELKNLGISMADLKVVDQVHSLDEDRQRSWLVTYEASDGSFLCVQARRSTDGGVIGTVGGCEGDNSGQAAVTSVSASVTVR